MKCEICGKELKNFQALGNHLHLTHNDFDKQQYYDLYLKKNKLDGQCIICGNKTKFLGIDIGYKDYCSIDCASKNSKIKYSSCKICGDFCNSKGFGAHIVSHHNMKLKDYYDIYLKKETDDKCIVCGKTTKFISITKGYEKYCSTLCKSNKTGKKIIHCKICNTDFTTDSIVFHLTSSHNITSQQYYDLYIKSKNEGNCIICGKPAQYINIKNGYSKYCSVDCQAIDNSKDVSICKLCGEHFIDNHSLSTHIKISHNISTKNYYDEYIKQPNEGICVICGKPTRFVTFVLGYSKHCSRECQYSDNSIKVKYKKTIKNRTQEEKDNIQKKIKQTKLERYGNENYNNKEKIVESINNRTDEQKKHTKEKTRQTLRNKYGVDYTFQSKEIQSKSKQTKLERYGDENYNNAEKLKETLANRTPEEIQAIQEKIKKTNMERYGVSSAWHSPQAHEAMKKKYGVEYALQSKEIYEKTLDTQEEKYGNRYAITTPDIKQKAKETLKEHFGVENTWESKEIREKSAKTKEIRYGDPTYTNPEKIKETNLEKYGITTTFNLHNIREITSSAEVRQKAIESARVTWEQQGGHPMTRQDVVDKVNETRQNNSKLDKELDDPDE